MLRWRKLGYPTYVVGLVGILGSLAVAIWQCNRESPPVLSLPPSTAGHTSDTDSVTDDFYKKLPGMVDPEHRVEQLDKTMSNDACDLTALVGMPDEYRSAELEYTQAVLADIGAVSLTRRRFYHQDRKGRENHWHEYPDDANPIYDRDVVVPLVILPRPDAVNQWSTSTEGRSLGWRTQDEAIDGRGSAYGRTLIFNPGKLSVNPISWPASPFQTGIPSWDAYVPDADTTFFLNLGKVVLTPDYDPYKGGDPKDRSASLLLGEKDGAKLLGEFVTVPACFENTRLRWVSIQQGTEVRRFLAYFLVDGNGAKRAKGSQNSRSGQISPYVRPLSCLRHQPKIIQHDELLLPTPMAWPPTHKARMASQVDYDAHEEWCLDDWFPAQKDACWVIREAEDSKPLQESFLLMPASQPSERPVFFTALFAETEPKQLIQELAALYQVSPDKALNSPETMQRLQALYEKVRDFPLSK